MARKRRLQNVSTLENRKRVTLWMIHEVENSGTPHQIAAKAVYEFDDEKHPSLPKI